VLIDQTGTFWYDSNSAAAGTFGSTGQFTGAGSNILVLNGDVVDLDNALNSITVSEDLPGPDTIDIEVFGTYGQLADKQINVLAKSGTSTSSVNSNSNSQGWIQASEVINQGTVLSTETLTWNTIVGVASTLTSGTATVPEFVKTDMVYQTLIDYDESGGVPTNGTALFPNLFESTSLSDGYTFGEQFSNPIDSWSALNFQTESLVVSSTTNIFNSSGTLIESVDTLVAPIFTTVTNELATTQLGPIISSNITLGVDGNTLGQWGTQVTHFNVPGNADWNYGTYSSATLTINDEGETIEALFQGGLDQSSVLDNIYNPDVGTSILWQQMQTTTAFDNAGTNGVAEITSQIYSTTNPFWDFRDWGTPLIGSVATEVWGNDMTLPESLTVGLGASQILDVFGNNNTITANSGCTVGISGTDVQPANNIEPVTIPGTVTINGNSITVLDTIESNTLFIAGISNRIFAVAQTDIEVVGTASSVYASSNGVTVSLDGNRESVLAAGKNDIVNVRGIEDSVNVVNSGTINIMGNDDTIGSSPSSNIILSGISNIVNSSNSQITLTANASDNEIIGNSNTIGINNSANSGFSSSITISGTSNVINNNDSKIVIVEDTSGNQIIGNSNTVEMGNFSTIHYNGTGELFFGSNDTIYTDSSISTMTLSGIDDSVYMATNKGTVVVNGDSVTIMAGTSAMISTAGDFETVGAGIATTATFAGKNETFYGSSDNVVISPNSVMTLLSGNSNLITVGTSSAISVAGTGDIIIGSHVAISTYGTTASVSVIGNDNTILSTASPGSSFGFTGTGEIVNASNVAIYGAANAEITVNGTQDIIGYVGMGSISASSASLDLLRSTYLTLNGSNDQINMSMLNEVLLQNAGKIGFISGASDAPIIDEDPGYQIVAGFNSALGDQIDLSQIAAMASVTAANLSDWLTVTPGSSRTTLTFAAPLGSPSYNDTVLINGVYSSVLGLITDNVFKFHLIR
jgi:hypothetical protein